jgi:hypothetical protein
MLEIDYKKKKRTMPGGPKPINNKNHSPCSRLNGVSSLFHPSSSLINKYFSERLLIKAD